jgi:glucan biosynthesis protein C
MERRYDIDWLRVIAIGLLLVYHVTIGFQPWGVFIQFIQSNEPLEELWTIMSMINIWRIPFLFFVSGMGVFFAMRKRSWQKLIKERSKRILVPFLFGSVVIVPIHVMLWSEYYNQDYQFSFNPAHLWFLGNIFSYVLLGLPFFYWVFSKRAQLQKRFEKWLNHPLKLIILSVPFVAEVLLISPDSYETYAMTWHGYFIGLLAFIHGFLLMVSGEIFWQVVKKWHALYLFTGFVLYVIRVFIFDLNPPIYLLPLETVLWILGVFGFGFRYLNKPSNLLTYLSQAAYPIYIVHMIWIYLGSTFFFQFDMHPIHQFILVITVTFMGSFVTYHFIIRPINILRPFFGLKSH